VTHHSDTTHSGPGSSLDYRLIADTLARLIEEEFCPKGCEIAPKWKGGRIVIHPGSDSSEKEIPFDVFFKKLLTVRDSLRLIEQKIGASDGIDEADKASIQSYLSRAYGALTSFNVLFKNDSEKFVGQGKTKAPASSTPRTLPRSPLNEF
jgi:hypothetical protein